VVVDDTVLGSMVLKNPIHKVRSVKEGLQQTDSVAERTRVFETLLEFDWHGMEGVVGL